MTEVKILMERVDKGWVASVHDEVGKVGDCFYSDRHAAVHRAKEIAKEKLGHELVFRVEWLR